jgi:hypothetical protein
MSEKNTWLKDNITSIMAILWTLATVIIIIVILTREVKTDDKTTYLILGSQYGLAMLMAGYYWGSTKSFNEKVKMDSEATKSNADLKQEEK